MGFQPSRYGSQLGVYSYVLDVQDIANKYVSLPNTPSSPQHTLVQIQNGVGQFANSDFIVNGQILSWAGLAMELLVEPGQKIHVTYI